LRHIIPSLRNHDKCTDNIIAYGYAKLNYPVLCEIRQLSIKHLLLLNWLKTAHRCKSEVTLRRKWSDYLPR
jgi:hypothetical protein